ncbi:MAG: twin-arginine translocase subunit TatC [Polyangiaceae bacterium]|nr:twin-arginine translocase subunit TatC [Polyangiaceae bacterium]
MSTPRASRGGKDADAAARAAAAKAKAHAQAAAAAQGEEEDGEEGTPMTFWQHLDELRSRLVRSLIAFFVATMVVWNYHERLKDVLAAPFVQAWREAGLPGNTGLHSSAPATEFVAYFKLSMIGGVLVASPFIFYQLWGFIAPGLYAREKRFVVPFVFFSTLLFVGGAFFGYRVAIPISLTYFLGLSGGEIAVTPTWMIDTYFEYVGQLLLGFGLVFELPLLLLFLSIAGVVNYLQLMRFGRWFVLVAFIIGAILTPPDVTSQLVMAVPLCLLYVFSIGLAYLFGKPPTEAQREAYRRSKEKDKDKAGAEG